ncbi:MAG TPA: hypothetical protein VER06_00120 [Candidatus Methanoperedens sp.]|nr:hypothetical protein [Candidatus Methanoperedens sp.]
MEIVRDPSRRVLRQFSVVWTIVAAGAAVSLHLSGGAGAYVAGTATCAAFGLAGIAFPPAARTLFLALSYATFPIGYALSLIMLAAIYFLVFTPLGGLMRLAGMDPLRIRRGRGAASGWERRENSGPASRYVRQY